MLDEAGDVGSFRDAVALHGTVLYRFAASVAPAAEVDDRVQDAVLRHYVDLRVDEIADLMGCSAGTVKSRLHDAHRALSMHLGVIYARD